MVAPSPSKAPPSSKVASALPPLVPFFPAAFVLLWSTGFIFAEIGTRYAGPLTFLGWRFVVATLLLACLAWALGARWPMSWQAAGHQAVVGALVHAAYLGGVFIAIDRGMPPALASLIVALQPLLTAAVVGPLLQERVGVVQVAGLVMGFVGVGLVLSAKLSGSGNTQLFEGFGLFALVSALIALVTITIGVVYQKRMAQGTDLLTGTTIQYFSAGVVTWAVAIPFEDNTVALTGGFFFAMAWLVLVLSLGAVLLLMALIQAGEASKTASLFYLVPPITALIALFAFGDRITPLAMAGMALAAGGVYLVMGRTGNPSKGPGDRQEKDQ